MASKNGESSSSAQASADALYYKGNPVLSSKTDTAFPLKKGKITLFSDFFKFCNFRLPITKFFKLVLYHYPIHISERHPLGLVNFDSLSLLMGPKDNVKDDGPPKYAYVVNALYTRLCGRPFECTVIPEGALVMAEMSLLWRDIKLYPSFRRDDEGEWSLFDFVNPPWHATDRVIGEHEPDVLKIHLE
ncbi:hypothetical protein Hanom_Chr05g00452321 [Helianthus anomalus]